MMSVRYLNWVSGDKGVWIKNVIGPCLVAGFSVDFVPALQGSLISVSCDELRIYIYR